MSLTDSSKNSQPEADISYIIQASLVGNRSRVAIKDTKDQDHLRTKGFGTKEGSEYILRPYEALYLVHSGRLNLSKRTDKQLTFNTLIEIFSKYDKMILTRFLIYRDLKSRGYVAKDGFGFGIDFRLYERGEFGVKPAKYVVFAVSEGVDLEASKLALIIQQIERMGKESILAVIERRGEIIYYKAGSMHFKTKPSNPPSINGVWEKREPYVNGP
ncbi:MAG TPA: tRNA-intron lyase [Nitrososphaeraceae archaeon]|jgi:tRNA-intron endonuclease